MTLSHLQHLPDFQIVSHHLLPPSVEFGYEIEDSSLLFRYRSEIRQHCNQSASAFEQVRLSRVVYYVTLVRSSSHRVQYEPNRGVKTEKQSLRMPSKIHLRYEL